METTTTTTKKRRKKRNTLNPECVTIIGVFINVITHDLWVSNKTQKVWDRLREREREKTK